MPRSNSPSRPKSAFRQVKPVPGLTQRTHVIMAPKVTSPPSAPSAPSIMPQTVMVEHKTGVWQSVKQGFGWGIGTNIARNLFGGPSVSPIVPSSASSAVPVPVQESTKTPEYTQCLKEGGDHEACKQYL